MNCIDNNELFLWMKKEISDYIGGYIENFKVLPLPGVGSTSQRSLIEVRDNQKSHLFVIKRYMIPGETDAECRRQAQQEYTVLLHLKAYPVKLWSVPEPVGFRFEDATIIMGFCPGENVHEIFWNNIKKSIFSRRNSPWLIQMMTDIAMILKDIQSIKIISENFVTETSDSYLESFFKVINALREQDIDLHFLQAIQNRFVNDLPALLTEEHKVFQHTDMYFNNIIRNNQKYYLLDFPNSCNGSIYWDISHMLVSLEDYKIFRNVDRKMIDACKNEFLKHFSVDTRLLHTMNLFHYCFSFNIKIKNHISGLKKIMTHSVPRFYKSKINQILSE